MIYMEQLVNGWIAWYEVWLVERQQFIISDKIEDILEYNPLHDFTGINKKRYGSIISKVTFIIF